MNSISLAELYKKGTFTSISNLRQNSSGYFFITLLQPSGDKTKSTNLYFGKRTSEVIEGTFSKGDSIAQFLKHASVVETFNKENEKRYKISTSENSNYSSEALLNEIWGSKEEKNSFDIVEFSKEFQEQTATNVPETTIEA